MNLLLGMTDFVIELLLLLLLLFEFGVLLGVVVILPGEYGADGLGYEGEESSMSVSEFKYAVYSGSVWNE